MGKHFLTLEKSGSHEIEIKKSRFITHLFRIESEEEAKQQIASIKKEHYKASHNCSAFVLGENRKIMRSSDDGEPSGTAGVPMLEVLTKQGLTNVLAVVTRYFGGVKLGSGGLIRAYSSSVSEAIKEVGVVKVLYQQEIVCSIDYTNLQRLQNFLSENPTYTLGEIEYAENVKVPIFVEEEDVEKIQDEIIDLCNNRCSFEEKELSLREVPINSFD